MRRFLFICILVLIGTCFFADTPKVGVLPKQSFQFVSVKKGLVINFSSDVGIINQTLGKSKINSEFVNETKFKKYSWDGLDLYVLPSNGIIQIMTITNNNFRTIGGISIGTDKVDIIDKLGQPSGINKSFLQYYYSTMDETWNLVFFLNINKVSSIQIHRLD